MSRTRQIGERNSVLLGVNGFIGNMGRKQARELIRGPFNAGSVENSSPLLQARITAPPFAVTNAGWHGGAAGKKQYLEELKQQEAKENRNENNE